VLGDMTAGTILPWMLNGGRDRDMNGGRDRDMNGDRDRDMNGGRGGDIMMMLSYLSNGGVIGHARVMCEGVLLRPLRKGDSDITSGWRT
jgi:hypothetical protein